MAKLVFATILLLGLAVQAKTLQLDFYGQAYVSIKQKDFKEYVGGISGLAWDGTKLIALSDDRGKLGTPRFYEMGLKIDSGKVSVTVNKVHYFHDVIKGWVLDLEGLALLPNGELLISSEGDNNKKPRALPHIFVASSAGAFKQDIPLPDKFLPDLIGQQKKGIENNRGFEALTVKKDGQGFYAINETPILADQGSDDLVRWLRIVDFAKDKENFKAVAEYPYALNRSAKNEKGPEIYRGVSEMLNINDKQVLVLERGARLTTSGMAYTAGIYLADLTTATDSSHVPSFAKTPVAAAKKTLLADLEQVLKNQHMENYEALSWGPPLPDGRKSLLVMSDNNFSAKEKTILLVFAVKEVP